MLWLCRPVPHHRTGLFLGAGEQLEPPQPKWCHSSALTHTCFYPSVAHVGENKQNSPVGNWYFCPNITGTFTSYLKTDRLVSSFLGGEQGRCLGT